ncbi:hypothetical protein [Rufibacter ruber]|uniref:hypothetical protein n=1 Tax=Rufibacter ruber TaxID=1783499 RepID=UPI000B247319|nr:hypothetical protein [Rufibacter ruber]
MKKIFAMIAMGAMIAGTSFAQDAPKKDRKPRTERAGKDGAHGERKSPEEFAAKRTEMISKKYGLSKAQEAKLLALHQRQTADMKALRGQGTEKSQVNRDAMKARHAQWESELKGILTPEQYARYEADQKQRMEHRGKKRGQYKGQRHQQEQKS